jgi:hypothetical protein
MDIGTQIHEFKRAPLYGESPLRQLDLFAVGLHLSCLPKNMESFFFNGDTECGFSVKKFVLISRTSQLDGLYVELLKRPKRGILGDHLIHKLKSVYF